MILYLNNKTKKASSKLLILGEIMVNGIVTFSSLSFLWGQTEFFEVLINIPSLIFIIDIGRYMGA